MLEPAWDDRYGLVVSVSELLVAVDYSALQMSDAVMNDLSLLRNKTGDQMPTR